MSDPPATASIALRRVGVIGDVHAEHRRLEAALDFMSASKVDAVFCTGDIADGTGDVDVCCELLRGAHVRTVAGNHDRWLLGNRSRDVPHAHALNDLSAASREYFQMLPATRTMETVGGAALLCHGVADNDMRKVWPGSSRMAIERSRELDALIDAGRVRYVVNGHLHYRVVVNFERLTLVNAGTLRGDHRPGVSLVDFGSDEISAFEFDPRLRLERVAERRIDAADDRRVWRNTQDFDGHWTPIALYGG